MTAAAAIPRGGQAAPPRRSRRPPGELGRERLAHGPEAPGPGGALASPVAAWAGGVQAGRGGGGAEASPDHVRARPPRVAGQAGDCDAAVPEGPEVPGG